MKIHDDHLYHGAALIQIAEHPQFTAINTLKLNGEPVRVAYKINDDIAVYLKYSAIKPNSNGEYVFTFSRSHLQEIAQIARANSRCFIVLVCVKEREICVLTYTDLLKLLKRREKALGREEDNLTVLVTAPKNSQFRVYVNAPGKRGTLLGKMLVRRSAFPDEIFQPTPTLTT